MSVLVFVLLDWPYFLYFPALFVCVVLVDKHVHTILNFLFFFVGLLLDLLASLLSVGYCLFVAGSLFDVLASSVVVGYGVWCYGHFMI